MKFGKTNRRRFLLSALLLSPMLALTDALWVERTWIRTRFVRIGTEKPTHRIVHFTDLHHKGDRAYLEGIVQKINALSADFVCFTGDLIEERSYVPEALEFLEKIKSPLYGVPGNHDYWARADFGLIGQSFASTGGAWLMDEQITIGDGTIHLTGASCAHWHRSTRPKFHAPKPGGKNIMLLHYPIDVLSMTSKFDLILAGHSHGGQIRIPFYGPLITPSATGPYDQGLFETPSGPLYVNPGLGWFYTPVRFNCRPEITVFDV